MAEMCLRGCKCMHQKCSISYTLCVTCEFRNFHMVINMTAYLMASE